MSKSEVDFNQTWSVRLRRFHRRNLVVGCYPGSLRSALTVVAIITSLNLAGTDLTCGLTSFFQQNLKLSNALSCILSSLIIWSVTCSIMKFLVRRLLQYRGWLYEGSRPSLRTKLFVLSVRLLNGWFLPLSNKLYGLQGILPTLPVPSVEQSVQRYISSMKSLLTEEKFEKLETQGKEFVQKYGSQLQRYLIFKYWSSQNYVSDWWEQYVYLMGRSPLLIQSNFYCIDAVEDATSDQAARAAMLTLGSLQFREAIDNQTLKPLIGQGVIPLCSSQYERAYNTTRVPGETTDTIVHFDSSSHVVVYHQGKYFHVPIAHANGELLSLAEMQLQFQRILRDTSKPAQGEEKLAALTGWDRTNWAKTRTAFFSHGINKISLDKIERAAFIVSLDDEEYSSDIYAEETPHLDKLAMAGLHGNGYNRWCDKSFNFAVGTNGRATLHVEHSYADAPIVSQMCQLNMKAAITYKSILDDKGVVTTPTTKIPPVPTRLEWDLPDACLNAIESAVAANQRLIDDVDVKVLSHRPFGKGLMKKCKVSPDAFIQMALQLAYYRISGKFDLTYEAAMTRFYKFGRTETVRSCTEESCRWVRAMDSDATQKEKLDLFKEAWEKHQLNYRLSMSGKGFDRHFFGLYVVSKYLKIDSEFLKEALGSPWKLSTSQTPTWQESVNEPPLITAGGGFGATCPDGYGVSYIVGGDHSLVFHVTSYRSCPATDSTKFVNEIARALDDIRLLHGVELEENRIFKKSS